MSSYFIYYYFGTIVANFLKKREREREVRNALAILGSITTKYCKPLKKQNATTYTGQVLGMQVVR